MPKTDFALQFKKTTPDKDGLPVIIVAAGSSSRMQGIDKLFAPIGGIPVIAITLRAFENSPLVSEITVVTRKDKQSDISLIAEKYAIGKLKQIVEGGSCREESVKNGVCLYKGREDKVLVHDAARPFITGKVIENVVLALRTSDSVTCAVTVKDTVKTVDENGVVVSTLDRSHLAAVQTPQGVSVAKFLEIAESAEDLAIFTDDTAVMESAGIQTQIVEGDYNNIKLTTPEDMVVAEALVEKEW